MATVAEPDAPGKPWTLELEVRCLACGRLFRFGPDNDSMRTAATVQMWAPLGIQDRRTVTQTATLAHPLAEPAQEPFDEQSPG